MSSIFACGGDGAALGRGGDWWRGRGEQWKQRQRQRRRRPPQRLGVRAKGILFFFRQVDNESSIKPTKAHDGPFNRPRLLLWLRRRRSTRRSSGGAGAPLWSARSRAAAAEQAAEVAQAAVAQQQRGGRRGWGRPAAAGSRRQGRGRWCVLGLSGSNGESCLHGRKKKSSEDSPFPFALVLHRGWAGRPGRVSWADQAGS